MNTKQKLRNKKIHQDEFNSYCESLVSTIDLTEN